MSTLNILYTQGPLAFQSALSASGATGEIHQQMATELALLETHLNLNAAGDLQALESGLKEISPEAKQKALGRRLLFGTGLFSLKEKKMESGSILNAMLQDKMLQDKRAGIAPEIRAGSGASEGGLRMTAPQSGGMKLSEPEATGNVLPSNVVQYFDRHMQIVAFHNSWSRMQKVPRYELYTHEEAARDNISLLSGPERLQLALAFENLIQHPGATFQDGSPARVEWALSHLRLIVPYLEEGAERRRFTQTILDQWDASDKSIRETAVSALKEIASQIKFDEELLDRLFEKIKEGFFHDEWGWTQLLDKVVPHLKVEKAAALAKIFEEKMGKGDDSYVIQILAMLLPRLEGRPEARAVLALVDDWIGNHLRQNLCCVGEVVPHYFSAAGAIPRWVKEVVHLMVSVNKSHTEEGAGVHVGTKDIMEKIVRHLKPELLPALAEILVQAIQDANYDDNFTLQTLGDVIERLEDGEAKILFAKVIETSLDVGDTHAAALVLGRIFPQLPDGAAKDRLAVKIVGKFAEGVEQLVATVAKQEKPGSELVSFHWQTLDALGSAATALTEEQIRFVIPLLAKARETYDTFASNYDEDINGDAAFILGRFVKKLGSDPDILEEVVPHLSEDREQLISQMEEGLFDEDSGVREKSIKALGRVLPRLKDGARQRRVMDKIESQLTHNYAGVRREAIHALKGMLRHVAVEEMVRLQRLLEVFEFIETMNDKDLVIASLKRQQQQG